MSHSVYSHLQMIQMNEESMRSSRIESLCNLQLISNWKWRLYERTTCLTISFADGTQAEEKQPVGPWQAGKKKIYGGLPAYSNKRPNHCLSSLRVTPELTHKINFTLSAAPVEAPLPHNWWGQFWLKALNAVTQNITSSLCTGSFGCQQYFVWH